MLTPPLQKLRNVLGKSLIQLSTECASLVAADDGNNWLCFPRTETDANMALFQDGSREYLSLWIKNAMETKLDHYLVVGGDAAAHTDLIKEFYTFVSTMAFMSFDLVSCPLNLVKDPRVRYGSIDERDQIATFLGKGFGTSADCESTAASAAGHDSPNVRCFIIEDEGEIQSVAILSIIDDIAGIWSVSSAEKFRRRGLARAVVQAALLESQALGVGTVILSSSEMAEHMYLATGWLQIERFDLFVSSAPSIPTKRS